MNDNLGGAWFCMRWFGLRWSPEKESWEGIESFAIKVLRLNYNLKIQKEVFLTMIKCIWYSPVITMKRLVDTIVAILISRYDKLKFGLRSIQPCGYVCCIIGLTQGSYYKTSSSVSLVRKLASSSRVLSLSLIVLSAFDHWQQTCEIMSQSIRGRGALFRSI